MLAKLQENGLKLLPLIIPIILLVILSYWSGIPTQNSELFIVGVLFFCVVIAVFLYAGWHLLIRPLPENRDVPEQSIPASVRQLLAVLLAISGINLVVGAYWDEVWHRIYRFPFGEDLLWRPHLLMYSCFLLVSLLALGGLWYLMRNGRGTMQQRFRANPIVGLLVLIGGFLIFVVPADPPWHEIYGEDISAWSAPHLILGISFAGAMILSAALYLSTIAKRQWTSLIRLRVNDWLVNFVFAFMFLFLSQIFITEWDAVAAPSENFSLDVISARPEWIFPILVIALSGFVGTLTVHALRAVGAATAMGVVALVIRLLLVESFDFNAISANPWVLALPPLIALDVFYALVLRRQQDSPSWWLSGVVIMLGVLLGTLPLMPGRVFYPEVTLALLPPTVIIGGIIGMGANWYGRLLGDFLATSYKALPERTSAARNLVWLPPVAAVGTLVFIIYFVITATPPV